MHIKTVEGLVTDISPCPYAYRVTFAGPNDIVCVLATLTKCVNLKPGQRYSFDIDTQRSKIIAARAATEILI